MQNDTLKFKNMEKFEQQSNKPEKFSIFEALDQLQRTADILHELGLEVIDRFIEEKFAKETAFPIVKDGLNGIRASYSKLKGLKIWFTNGFEDQNNPKRQEITRRLKEAGLPVV